MNSFESMCFSHTVTDGLLAFVYRWSAYVVNGEVKVLNVEKVPSDFEVSGGEVILEQI